MRRRLAPRIVSVLVLILVLSLGCSRPSPSPTAPQAAPAAPAAATPAPAPAPAVELGDPVPAFKLLVPAQPYLPEPYEACSLAGGELRKAGFAVDLVTHPTWAAFTAQVRNPFDWGIACQVYVPREDRLEPHTLLGTLTSDFKDIPNYAGYASPEFDQAIAAERSELDPEKRRAAVHKTQEIMARDLPFVSLFHTSLTHVYNKAKFGEVVSIPGVGLWNTNNFIRATPLTSDEVYRVGYVGDIGNLNPLAPFATSDLDLLRLIADSLGQVRPDATVGPWLAEKWEALTPTSIRVTIRSGHKFHDGQPVTARDVAFTYNFLLKWKPPFYNAFIEPIQKVEVLDDRTALFTLKRPHGPILLTFATVPVLPEHLWKDVVEKQGAKNPSELKEIPRVGSGPYKWASYTPQTLRLVRNDNHFNPPKAKEFLYTTYANRETQFLALVNQTVSFHEPKGLTLTQAEEAKRYPHLGLLTEPSIAVYWAMFNMREKSPFRDYTLRSAVAHLLDVKSYVRDILKGQGEPGRGMIAPANKYWHNSAIPSQEVPGQVHYNQFDPAKARQILQKAGFGWDSGGKLRYPKNYKATVLPAPAGCCD